VRDSYLNIPAIISAALISGAQAVHPGYGFLSEDFDFAEVCKEHGLVFIGPPPEVLARFHDKADTRLALKRIGVPVVPGSEGSLRTASEALRVAESVGYPVMLKARAGGGGRGMRKVQSPGELQRLWDQARAEAKSAFGDERVYLEKNLEGVRHIEAQVLVDEHGTAVCLGERDCSIQRRHQKILEEAPSPTLSEELRRTIADTATQAALELGYRNIGTFEFLVDRAGNFYFIEVNARLQVEHTITEAVTGIDLVKEQIRLAAGEPLSFSPEQVFVSGHAIECRINAEDPANNFAPMAGTVSTYLPPSGPGIRVDSHLFSGYEVPPYYDSLLAKLVAWGRDRPEAIARMLRALDELTVTGISTNIAFHKGVLASEVFRSGQVTTHLLDTLGVEAIA
jgi:acetyl-CoA carboxylase biotin carboxylase subunit